MHLDAKRRGGRHTSARCVGRAGLTPLPPRGGGPEPGWSPVEPPRLPCRCPAPGPEPRPRPRSRPRRVPAEIPRSRQGKRRRPVRAPCEPPPGPSGRPRNHVSRGSGPSSRPWPRRTRARGLALEGSAYPGSPLPTSALDPATRRGGGGGWGAGCSSPRPLSSLLTGFLRRKLLQGQTGNLCNPRRCGSPGAPNLTP